MWLQVEALATRQHGVLTRQQLAALGLTPAAIENGVASGRLHRVHQGVFAAGHPRFSQEGRWMAALLACGAGAALSHRSAAGLWGIRPSSTTVVDVTVPTHAGRQSRPSVVVHRCRSLKPQLTTVRRGIPVTTPARTLLDLATILTRRELERALHEAQSMRLVRVDELHAAARRARGPRRRLLAILDDYALEVGFTRSELELLVRDVCREHRLPRPRANAVVEGREVDFLWEQQRLIVEADSHRHHGTRDAFERDRARDQHLAAAGYRVLRFTYRQVIDDPAGVAKTLRSVLALADHASGVQLVRADGRGG